MDEVYLGSRTLQLDRQLLADGKRIHVGRRALGVLSALARAKGEIVTKGELLDQVWLGINVEENALPVHVVALRKALGPEARRLETIYGIGYRLKVDCSEADITQLSCHSIPDNNSKQGVNARQAVEGDQPALIELIRYRKDGTSFLASVKIAPLHDHTGSFAAFLASENDGSTKLKAAAIQREALAISQVARLSSGQREVLALLSRGLVNKLIAHQLGISERTVRMHRSEMLKVLGVRSTAEAIRIAGQANL